MKAWVLGVCVSVAAVSLVGCGGGGGDNGSTNITSNASIPGAQQVSTIKLADSANSYATGKTAAGYVLYGSRDVYQLYLSSLAAMIYGANHSAAGSYSEACASGGTISVTLTDSDNSRSITGGDSANISFVNCKQSVSTLAGLVTETINGGMSFKMKTAVGAVGSNGDYTFVADVTTSNLTVATNTASGVINGTMTFSEKHTAANNSDSLTAATSAVTVLRTIGTSQDSIAMLDWTEADNYSAQTDSDTVSVYGKLNVTSASGNAYLLVSTPVPIVVSSSGSLTSGSVKFATTTDAITATFAGNTNVTLAIDAGNKGATTAVVPTTVTEMTSLLKL